ncbi:hypothetical protein D4765_08135 [Subtercola vilae]|uniref:Uncharacterized protein n=2 Tax=Subtercola vilae TaxID=2056433 RepID=A0A4T2C090_9MICO|nr:hypothetical protein D4765_08135 [Subtercola vilae]
MSALVTEHFVLQSAASSTISESGSRASIYLAALSSGLVAVGFSSSSPGILAALSFTVFPTVFILGCFTVVRLVDTSIANVVAQNRIELIRRFYADIDPAAATYFQPDNTATVGTMGVKYGRTAVLFTTASMITVVNSVLGGAGIAVVLTIGTGVPLIAAVITGIAFGLLVLALLFAYQVQRIRSARP